MLPMTSENHFPCTKWYLQLEKVCIIVKDATRKIIQFIPGKTPERVQEGGGGGGNRER